MKKERVAQILTIGILAAVLLFAIGKNRGWSLVHAQGASPQDVIYAMLDAARQGDVRAYLANFSGAPETQLRRTISDSSEGSFAAYLRNMNSALKGVAVMAPEAFASNQVKVQVDYVYQDRNEAQIVRLEKAGADWKIVDLGSSDRIRTIVPYGTPVEGQ